MAGLCELHLAPWLGWFGVAIFAFTLWLKWRAYAALGRNWSPKIDISEGQKLVTDGVYRYIRHPIYAGMWLWGLAHPLLLQNWFVRIIDIVLWLRFWDGQVLEYFTNAVERCRVDSPKGLDDD